MSGERLLLEAVLEALALPYDTPGYEQRIEDRASIAKVIIREALAENPDQMAWNADYLRSRLREEEARHQAGEQS